MPWVCPTCSNNNEDSMTNCLLCFTEKPAEKPASESICTLTKRRAAEIHGGEVFIPSEYNVIGEEAFKGRTDITEVYVHSGVKKIMRSAFEGCTGLYLVRCDAEPSSIGARAFAGCHYLCPERRPTAQRVASDAFEGCSATFVPPPERAAPVAPPRPKTPPSPSYTPRSSTPPRPSTTSTTPPRSTTASGGYTGFTPPRTTYVPTPPPSPTRPYIPTPPSYPPTRVKKSPLEWWHILLAAVLAVGIIVGLLTYSGKYMNAESWGDLLTLVLIVGIGSFSAYMLMDAEYESHFVMCLSIVAFMIVFDLFDGDGVATNFFHVSLALAITSGVALVLSLIDEEKKSAKSHGSILVFGVIMVIFMLVEEWYNFDSRDWQLFAAILISAALVIPAICLRDDYDFRMSAIFFNVLCAIVLLILMLVCRERLATVLTVIPIALASASGVLVYTAHSEDGFFDTDAWWNLICGVVHILITLAVNIFYV